MGQEMRLFTQEETSIVEEVPKKLFRRKATNEQSHRQDI